MTHCKQTRCTTRILALNVSSTNFPAMMSSKTGQNAPRLQQALFHYCKDTHEENHPTHKKKASCKYTSVNTSASTFLYRSTKASAFLYRYPQVCGQVHQQGEVHRLLHELQNNTNVWSSIRRAREKQSVLMSFQ